MTKELTLKDLERALKYLDDNPTFTTYKDIFQEVTFKNGFPYSFRLTDEGRFYVNNFVGAGQKELDDTQIIDVCGIKVVRSDAVKEDKTFKW